MTTFHLRLKGKVLPPMAEEKIKKMLELGQLDSNGQVSQDGTNWIEISQHPVFKSSIHPSSRNIEPVPPKTNAARSPQVIVSQQPVFSTPPANGISKTWKIVLGCVAVIALLFVAMIGVQQWAKAKQAALVEQAEAAKQAEAARQAEIARKQQEAIKNVLDQCCEIAAAINKENGPKEQFWDPSPLLRKRVNLLQRIDIVECPEEFQKAFQQHIQASEDLANIVKKYNGWRGVVKGFCGGLLVLPDIISETDDAQQKAVSTCNEMIRVAQRYGVKP